jgi:hypothetical protein
MISKGEDGRLREREEILRLPFVPFRPDDTHPILLRAVFTQAGNLNAATVWILNDPQRPRSCAEGLDPQPVVLLGGEGIFRRWGLVGK